MGRSIVLRSSRRKDPRAARRAPVSSPMPSWPERRACQDDDHGRIVRLLTPTACRAGDRRHDVAGSISIAAPGRSRPSGRKTTARIPCHSWRRRWRSSPPSAHGRSRSSLRRAGRGFPALVSRQGRARRAGRRRGLDAARYQKNGGDPSRRSRRRAARHRDNSTIKAATRAASRAPTTGAPTRPRCAPRWRCGSTTSRPWSAAGRARSQPCDRRGSVPPPERRKINLGESQPNTPEDTRGILWPLTAVLNVGVRPQCGPVEAPPGTPASPSMATEAMSPG